jgi:hypothetical protein
VDPSSATDYRVERFRHLLRTCGIEPAKIQAAMGQHGANRFTELDEAKQDALLEAMQKAADAKAAQPKN